MTRRAIAPLICALALAALPDRASAEIRAEIRGGRLVYTSRPPTKPGTQPRQAARSDRPIDRAPAPIAAMVIEASRRHGLDPDLVATVISVESAFDPAAISPKGARGLMQLMPATARRYGVLDPHDPGQNIEGGVSYLKHLIGMFRGNLTLALAAYNAGPGAVERAGGVPPYEETRTYITRIESRYGPLGGARTVEARPSYEPAAAGAIRARRDDDGTIVWTNRAGRR